MRAKPSEDDLRVWAAYARTVKAMPGRMPKPRPAAPPVAHPVVVAAPAPPAAKSTTSPPRVGQPPAGLDRASWRRFRIGQVQPARTLDLHGLTAAAAHRATVGLIQRAQADGLRCVEIVTGKGEVLARELPLWLEAPPLRGLILALAYSHAANTGAVRVLLRRLR